MLERAARLLLTMYRKKADYFGSRSYSPPSRSVELLAIKRLAPWLSLTSVYPYSSHSLVLSGFDRSPYPSGFWRNSDQPQYVRRNKTLVPLSENDILSLPSLKKCSSLGYHPAPKRKLLTKQRAPPYQKRAGA